MQLLSGVLVVGAILMASSMSSVEGHESMSEYCNDLDQKMSKSGENFADPEATYKLAHSLISHDRSQLDNAWRAVIHKEDCTSKSHEFLSVIYTCWPDRFKSMQILEIYAQEYVEKCFSDLSKFDDVLRDEIKDRSSDDSTGVTQFLDDEFIATYRRYNPDERYLDSLHITCCCPERSAKTVEESIIRLPENKEKDVASYYVQNPGRMNSVLEKNLYKPCEMYVDKVEHLMNTVKMFEEVNYQKTGTWIVKGFSDNFKNAIFRYKFCQSLDQYRTVHDFDESVLVLLRGYDTSRES